MSKNGVTVVDETVDMHDTVLAYNDDAERVTDKLLEAKIREAERKKVVRRRERAHNRWVERTRAAKNGHKLGHNNVKCKRGGCRRGDSTNFTIRCPQAIE